MPGYLRVYVNTVIFMYQRKNNIIYSCYSCPKEKEPKFLELHLTLAQKYAERIGCDFKVIANPETKYNPLVFVVYEAYKHFAESDYDKMLWIDWDVLISLNSPDIFEEYCNAEFCSWKWSESKNEKVSPDLSDYESEFIDLVCEASFSNDLKKLFMYDLRSGGVMLFSNKAMNNFLFGPKARWDDLYNRICYLRDINTGQYDGLLNLGGVLSHYVINYLLHVNDIPLTDLDKKWNTNSVTNDMKSQEYFFNFNCGGDEIDQGIGFEEKDTAALSYITQNKKLFFDDERDYNRFIGQFNQTEILNVLKKKYG